MKKPVIVINFKTYKQNKDVLRLAKIVEKYNKNIIIGVAASEISDVVDKTYLKVYAEHVDYFKPGKNTGYIIPEAVKKKGAKGVFLNHSEHRLEFDVIKKTVKRCKEVGLKTLIFAKDIKSAKRIEALKPDYLVYEPPEFVGSKISVSSAKPEVIEKISKKVKMNVLVGAGIRTKEDVEVAMKLGSAGVAFSSEFMKSKNPRNVLKKLFD